MSPEERYALVEAHRESLTEYVAMLLQVFEALTPARAAQTEVVRDASLET